MPRHHKEVAVMLGVGFLRREGGLIAQDAPLFSRSRRGDGRSRLVGGPRDAGAPS